MKPERLLLLLTILGIFLLPILSNFNKPIITGEIVDIKITKNSINLELKNISKEIILINEKKLSEKIKIGRHVKIYGNIQREINKTIVFVDKLVCLDC